MTREDMMRPSDKVVRHCVEWRNRWHPNVPIYDALPEGWRVIHGTTTQPTGCVWIENGAFFLRRDGKLTRNPKHRAVLMWDERYC